jgi:hypothetical protein
MQLYMQLNNSLHAVEQQDQQNVHVDCPAQGIAFSTVAGMTTY